MHLPLTTSLNQQQTQLVQIICDAVPARNIYLLGSTIIQQQTETLFMKQTEACQRVGHYYVLVLVQQQDNTGPLQDKLENISRQSIPLTALVVNTQTFLQWLQDGHPFACRVQQQAILLHGDPVEYDESPSSRSANTAPGDCQAAQPAALQKVSSFLAGAELFIIRKEHKMAAFMLHQCAEHALLAILKKGSGLRVNTHSIDKLLRYCSMVDHRIPHIFPRHTEQQQRLFQLLQKAYIDTRYKDDYHIHTTDLEAIRSMLRKLVEILQQ